MVNKFIRIVVTMMLVVSTQHLSAALPTYVPEQGELPSLAPMLEKVNPAVVNISTFSKAQSSYNPLLNDPFFRRFFNIPEQEFQRHREPKKKQQSAIPTRKHSYGGDNEYDSYDPYACLSRQELDDLFYEPDIRGGYNPYTDEVEYVDIDDTPVFDR